MGQLTFSVSSEILHHVPRSAENDCFHAIGRYRKPSYKFSKMTVYDDSRVALCRSLYHNDAPSSLRKRDPEFSGHDVLTTRV